MKKKRNNSWTPWSRVPLGALCAVLLTAGPSAHQHAWTSLNDRMAGAERVVVATAHAVDVRWEENEHGDRLIVSRFLLDVSETLKGERAKTVWLDLEGGTLDGLTLQVSSLPQLQTGERAVFLLASGRGGVFEPHLRGQGILPLDDRDVVRGTTLTLQEIRTRALGLGK